MSPSRGATARRCSSPSTSRAWRSRPGPPAAPDRWSRLPCCWRWAIRPRWPAARSASRSGAARPPPTSTPWPPSFRTWSRGLARVPTAGRAERSRSLLEEAADHAGDAEGLADHLVVERLERVAELRGGLVALVGGGVEGPAQDVGEPRPPGLAPLLERLDPFAPGRLPGPPGIAPPGTDLGTV